MEFLYAARILCLAAPEKRGSGHDALYAGKALDTARKMDFV